MEDQTGVSLEIGVYGIIPELVIPFLCDPHDRGAVSLVCKRWYHIDGMTRKHVKVGNCYAATPGQVSRRFSHLESLKLKGKPRAAMFNLIPEDWGGYVTPWVEEVMNAFPRLKSINFRRMIVSDSDLGLLANSKGEVLEVLKLDNCSGFSTDGLFHITRSCRCLKTLFLEESTIVEHDGRWLHELALNNTVLENLNFYWTELVKLKCEDLELIAKNCSSLVSLKISDCDILDLIGFFRAATALEEFCGGCFNVQQVEQGGYGVFNERLGRYLAVSFPQRLLQLGLTYLENIQLLIVFPIAARLRKLDLLYTFLDTEGHCLLLQRCPNLEVLQTRNVIGDRGLQTLALFCKRLKRFRVERGADEQELEDEEGAVTQRGLIALAQGCLELEYLVVYVSDITNEALEYIGKCSKNLYDLRLNLLAREEKVKDLPLDNGVRSLMIGCSKLRRLCLYLRPGGLTDTGLSYIGQYSPKISWMLLGHVGESDEGLLAFSRGCPSLRKLEMRGCCFSGHAIATAVLQLTSLQYIWVQGYMASVDGRDLLPMVRPFWNIELIHTRVPTDDPNGENVLVQHPAHFLAYYSLAGQRTDYPDTVVPLNPSAFLEI